MKSNISYYASRKNKLDARLKLMVERYEASKNGYDEALSMRVSRQSQAFYKMQVFSDFYESLCEFAIEDKILGVDESSKTRAIWSDKK
jgi:hypothetical protein